MNAERQPTTPDEKRLFLLERLKEEWDVYPNKSRYTISQRKYHEWMREAGIDDFYQLQNYFAGLRDMGLVVKFDFLPDYY